jgi:hypothetical protein
MWQRFYPKSSLEACQQDEYVTEGFGWLSPPPCGEGLGGAFSSG